MSVPIFTSPGRSGFGPQLSLSYDSGSGNGPFGFGWSLSLPSITRKTDKGLPQYRDAEESDEFILSGAEDLVPVLVQDGDEWKREQPRHADHRWCELSRSALSAANRRIVRANRTLDQPGRPGGCLLAIDLEGQHHHLVRQDRRKPDLRPGRPTHIFSWLICESYDDKGNAIVYEYVPEDERNVDQSQANESEPHAFCAIAT